MSQKKFELLIVDDEPSVRSFLRVALEANGYSVTEANSGEKAIQVCASQKFDIILLDLGLTDLDGHEVLKRIRGWTTTPVIVLTVRDSFQEKVQLLDHGADDYLTKPFNMPELLARIRVALRKNTESDKATRITIGDVEVDVPTRQVFVRGTPVKLTATEFDLLKVLVRAGGRVVTQRQLLEEVWGGYAAENAHYLRIYIGHLRKKLSDSSLSQLILTEPGVGYRINIA